MTTSQFEPNVQRSVETCCYRNTRPRHQEDDSAICDLVQQETGFDAEFCQVSRAACEACCLSPWPCTDDLNPVIASLLCESATKVMGHSESSPSEVSSAERVRQKAIQRLDLLPRNPINSVRPAREIQACCFRGDAIGEVEDEQAYRCQHTDHELATESRCRSCRDWAVAPIAKRLSLKEMIPPPANRLGKRVEQWAVGVTTAPRRESTVATCIDSLLRAGWERPRLFVDAGANLPSRLQPYVDSWHAGRIGAWPNFLLGLQELKLRFPDADALMMVQDDAYFYDAANLRQYLEDVLWPESASGIVSLYSTDANAARLSGWHADDYRWLNGGLVFIFSPDAVDRFLADPEVMGYRKLDPLGGTVNLDLLIGNWAERERIPISYPMPSLVQHLGNTSTIWTGEQNGDMRRARCFAGDLETTFDVDDAMASFAELEFPVAEDMADEFQRRVVKGEAQMKEQTAVIAGLCRDVRIWLPRMAARIERLGEMFRDYRVVMFENDSFDRTLEFLEDWQADNPRVHVISKRLNAERYPQIRSHDRAARLAEYRNAYREFAVAEFGDMDHMIVTDNDLPGGWSFDGISTTFAEMEWDFVGSNGILRCAVPSQPPKTLWRHFDSWAFRAVGRMSADQNPDAGELVFHRGESLVPVWSCFGGLGVYRMECMRAASYSGQDCEHVCFHADLRRFGLDRLFLNPSQIVVY